MCDQEKITTHPGIGKWHDLPAWVSHKHHWFVVTDTHGDFDCMDTLVKAAPKEARIIHLGDIGDRGDFSYECFELLDQRPDIELIRGNHDLFVHEFLFGSDPILNRVNLEIWLHNGGASFIDRIYYDIEAQELLKRVILRQKLYLFDGNLFFVHSGLRVQDDFLSLSQKEFLQLEDYNVRFPENPQHLSWLGDAPGFFDQDENTVWKNFPVKPFFIHGHRRCSKLDASETPMSPLDKMRTRPRIDTWRIGVDTHLGLNGLEIKDGMFRFYEVVPKTSD